MKVISTNIEDYTLKRSRLKRVKSDYIFSLGNIAFIVAGLMVLLDTNTNVSLWGSLVNAVVITVFAATFFRDKLYFTAVANIVMAIIWYLIAFLYGVH